MRKLLYLLSAMLLLGKLDVAGACSMIDPPSDEQLFAKAATVLVGHVFRTEEIEVQVEAPGEPGSRAIPAVEGTFRLIEVLKGQPPKNGKFRGPVYIMCTVPVLVGYDYVLFLDGNNFTLMGLGTGQGFSTCSTNQVLRTSVVSAGNACSPSYVILEARRHPDMCPEQQCWLLLA